MKLQARFFFWILFVIISFIVMQLALRPFAYVFFFFILLLAPVSLFIAWFQRRHLQVKLTPSTSYVERNQKVKWTLQLNNPLLQSLRILGDKEFILEPKSLLEQPYYRLAVHTGPLPPPEPRLWMGDPMNFFLLALYFRKPEEVYVLPKPLPQSGPPLGIGDMLTVLRRPTPGMNDNAELSSTRPMQPGDPMKRIHWKLSSRIQEWVVREEEGHLLSQLIILLDFPKELEEDLIKRDEFLDRVAGLKLQNVFIDHAHLHTYLPEKNHIRFFRQQEVLEKLAQIPHGNYVSLDDQLEQEVSMPHVLYLILSPRKSPQRLPLSKEHSARIHAAFHFTGEEDTE